MEHIDGPQVWARLPMATAIDALEMAIGEHGFAEGPQRLHLREGEQDLLVMPAMADGWAGVKLVSLDRHNPERGLPFVSGVYALMTPPGLQPTLTIDGQALTAIRTAAVSGLATRYLARADASRLVVFGTGIQARSHLLAMAAVRPITDVRIVGRTAGSAEHFIEQVGDDLAEELDAPLQPGVPGDVAEADIICACTSSAVPIFDGSTLPAGVHINAVGSFRPDLQEVDETTVASSRVVVELREAALREKGDLLLAAATGWDPGAIVADLTELVREPAAGRTSDDERTLFSSVGHAYEDLVIARALATQ